MRPEKREKGSARYQFHDNHDGLLLDADPDEPDNVGVVVLFENPTLLEELFLMLFGECHLASFGCHCNHQVWSLGKYHLQTGIIAKSYYLEFSHGCSLRRCPKPKEKSCQYPQKHKTMFAVVLTKFWDFSQHTWRCYCISERATMCKVKLRAIEERRVSSKSPHKGVFGGM